MKFRIDVRLKEGVLDPQGVAILASLKHLGYNDASGVRVGRLIEVDVDAADTAAGEARVRSMCDDLLVNGVIEQYSVTAL